VTRASGGNGGAYNSGAAGSAGGANTGNGGGGGGGNGGTNTGTGGSGVVILAYPDSFPAFTSIDVGLTYSVSTVSRAGFRVYTFTSGTGTVTV
jgi:hypothetical protein